MTNKYQRRPRFYRNLQNLKEKHASTLFGVKPAPSILSISETRSRSSTHSIDLTKYQHQDRHPSPDPNQIQADQTVPHSSNHTLSTISSQPHTLPRPSLTSLFTTTTPTSPTSLTNNPTTPLLGLTTHIQTQSTQARHLFTQTSHLLSPTDRNWIESTISDTENATREILILTESFRVDQGANDGRVGIKSQLRWLVRDSRRAKEKRERLVLCHASLMGVLGRLQGLSLQGGGEGGFVQNGGSSGGGLSRGQGMRDGPGEGTVTSASGTTYGPGSDNGQRPDTPVWDLSVQLQDAGMEVVVPEPEAELLSPKMPASMTAQSAHSSVQGQEEVASTKMDNELMDMLSWRWAQGSQTQ
ncbi:hypothetical protein BDW59DRAFT_178385 [Aspergillus cavernicola]|uniref:Mediator complex subunit 11 n=1 Tax=Aspergillus cavernicola TaxID=176166 RepID=A0ABR4INP4_9EURO